jgi:DNA integrity scanning protein DisA with diadenylate cyclase activity
MSQPSGARLRRLHEELAESGLPPGDSQAFRAALVEEVDRALRPAVHERRIPSSGVLLDPRADPDTWATGTELVITRKPVGPGAVTAWRPFVDGLSSWLLRRTDGRDDEWVLFDRPAGSERDLVVLSDVLDATIVQRHPAGIVRVVGPHGVLRWEGLEWHHELPLSSWMDQVAKDSFAGDPEVLEAILRLALHDLASSGIGAALIYRPDDGPGPPVEERMPVPPPLQIRRPSHLGPLRQALAQVDGAAMFDPDGVLRQLGVLLRPSREAERSVDALNGSRHTSARRYSHDDPAATVITVSEDGPVSVLRGGEVLKRSP